MDILLNYQTDRNNGFSVVSSFDLMRGFEWGGMSRSAGYFAGTMTMISQGIWKATIYRDDPDIDQFLFHQLIDISETSPNMILRTAITDEVNVILAILNNYTHQIYVYTLDEFARFQRVQVITVPYIGANQNSQRIAIFQDYMVVSDWAYDNGDGKIGIIFIYQWDPVSNLFSLYSQITPPVVGNYRFGWDISIFYDTIFVGAPYYTTAQPRDGKVFIYDKSGTSWTLVQSLVGSATADGFYGWSTKAYIQTPTFYRLHVGNPGTTNAQGSSRIYHKVGGVWTLISTLVAPPAYQQNGNQFGYTTSIYKNYATSVAYGELGQGVLYLYKYSGGAWNLDIKTDSSPARYTQVGATDYGLFNVMTQGVVAISLMDGDKPSLVVLSEKNVGWEDYNVLVADKLYVKRTVDSSFYHLASGNQTIVFKLEAPIAGKYQVTLDVESAIMTIGPHNNKVYFVENGIYKMATLKYGTFTGASLASYVQERMNAISTWPNNYTITYNAVANKFTVSAINPFAFGSNLPDSLKDACQVKTMGFYDNHESVVHILYVSDVEASLTAPTEIGFNIIEGYPVIPVRNNCIFSEIGLKATLIGGRYKILESDKAYIKIPYKTSKLTFVFPDLNGGILYRINTNDITARLTAVDFK